MNKDPYEFDEKPIDTDGMHAYTFVSVGIQGDIPKMVVFQPMGGVFYNMALVDYDATLQTVDDEIVSNNGDMSKVLSTTWKIMLDFLKKFPEKAVFIQGNTDTKQKLYSRLITNNLLVLKQQYEVLGVLETGSTEFFDASKTYIAFVIQSL
jgi:predicted phosphohydrolase